MPGSPSLKPVVVRLYGIPGCGKTYLLNQLKDLLPQEHYNFHEGSEVLASLVPGGLDHFKAMVVGEQIICREQAINKIGRECASGNRVGVVTGHFMFWPKGVTDPDAGERVFTDADLSIYTHIIYLDIPIDSVLKYRRGDEQSELRFRDWMSPNVLREWQKAEKRGLSDLCAEHDILFTLVSPSPDWGGGLEDRIPILLEDFRGWSPELNIARAKARMDDHLLSKKDQLEAVLLMDGDRTLSVQDTGGLFWKTAQWTRSPGFDKNESTVQSIFSGPLGYGHNAFRQAVLLYEEFAVHHDFDRICRKVLELVDIHPKFVKLLKEAAKQKHIGVVIVTSGLGRLWDMIVAKAGLSGTVKVIGGGRLSDGFVVGADVKTGLVDHLHSVYNVHVVAFGDSVLDLGMLVRADEGIVVVGPEKHRSKTMDAPLLAAIEAKKGVKLRQALVDTDQPRLDIITLPPFEKDAVPALLSRRPARPQLSVRIHLRHATDRPSPKILMTPTRIHLRHATDRPSAKILMTPTRDATVAGPALRDAHYRIGQYLATEFVTELLGLEEYNIPHVQGHQTTGHRLRDEERTTIVAILRGGEPMAFGVSAVFPLAMFVHAKTPADLQAHHVQGQSNIILVDSVVNNGKTIVEFVMRLHTLKAMTKQVVVVAGVVQADAVTDQGAIAQVLIDKGKLNVAALRLSTNKFTGTGSTDTGNRLFNTTHLL